MRLSDQGFLNSVGKAVAPLLGSAVVATRTTGLVELASNYLALLTGRGAGTGWNRGEFTAAARLLRGVEDPVVLDCGANHGLWTRSVREALGSDRGRWILVDASPSVAETLAAIPNSEHVRVAIGDREGKATFHDYGSGSEMSSLVAREDTCVAGARHETYEVDVTTIDALLAARGIDRVDMMKMDLVGTELAALRGASESLRAGRIRAFSFEFGATNVNSRTFFRDYWSFLTPF